jgi:Alw26I/Eco31I/Esp3I family type II restriction m6 adenine DNA methyltransferase
MGDQASVSLRRSLVQRSALVDLAVYPSEARLFDRVDQPVTVACLRVGAHAGTIGTVRHFTKNASVRAEHPIDWSEQGLSASDYALPVAHGSEGVSYLARSFAGLPQFSTLESAGLIWAGRELDETRVAEKLSAVGAFPFIKGRMVSGHQVVEQPSAYVKPELAEKIRSAAHKRLVWRDVARASSKRRMIGTVIPAGWVAGNSLHVAYATDGDEERLLAVYAVMMSTTFEAQIRTRLSTGHMSLGVIRSAHVPKFDKRTRERLARAARSAISREAGAEHRLEVEAARAFGLDREAMSLVLGFFPKLTKAEVDAILAPAAWPRR